MNERERVALTEKVRRSENPYKALFGTDAITKNGPRKRSGTTSGLPPMRMLPDAGDRLRLQQRVMQRTHQIMKHLDPELYRDIYDAEMKLAVAKLATVDEKQTAPNPALKGKYGRNLVAAGTTKDGVVGNG